MGRAGSWGAEGYRPEDALAPKPSLRPKMIRAGRAQSSYPGYLHNDSWETEAQRGQTVWSIRTSQPHSHYGFSHYSGWPLSPPSRGKLTLMQVGDTGRDSREKGRKRKPQLPVVALGRLGLICSQSGSPDRTGSCSPWSPGKPNLWRVFRCYLEPP